MELEFIARVKGLGVIVETDTDFYTGIREFKNNEAVLISPRDEAYARIHTQGKENIGKRWDVRTTAGFEYAKGQFPIFRVNSRLTNPKLAKLAVEANDRPILDPYFHTKSTREYEDSLEQAEKDKSKEPAERNVIVLPSRSEFTMSEGENWEVYQAIFKDQANPYFELNGPITVNLVDSKTVDSLDGTILTQLLFRGLDFKSYFEGGDIGLCDGESIRGILKRSN